MSARGRHPIAATAITMGTTLATLLAWGLLVGGGFVLYLVAATTIGTGAMSIRRLWLAEHGPGGAPGPETTPRFLTSRLAPPPAAPPPTVARPAVPPVSDAARPGMPPDPWGPAEPRS